MYRPPNTSKPLFITELQKTIHKIDKQHDLFILGDMNIDIAVDKPIKHKYLNVLSDYGLLTGITQYTRVESRRNETVSKSCIDHIFVRSRSQDVFTAVLGTVLADHRAIALACTVPSRIQAAPKYRTIVDSNLLKEQLDMVDWGKANNIDCPIEIYNYIKKTLKFAITTLVGKFIIVQIVYGPQIYG